MTAREWLSQNPDAAQWAKTTYDQFPGRQKHGVWQAIFQGLKERGYPGSLNAIRIVMTDRDMVSNTSSQTIGTAGDGESRANRGPSAPTEGELGSPSLHVKKLHVHVPREIVTPAGGMLTAVLYGDTHIPFHDQRSLDVVAQVIRIARPDVIGHQGDLLDCYHLSRFDKNPKRLHRLQDEIDAARQHLAAFRLLVPQARFILLGGNHEDRLRRTLWSLPPHAEALMGLEAVTQALTWPKLLGLDELGIEHYDYGDQTRAQIDEPFLPHFMLKHGTVVRKLSAYTARAELDKYNRSGASGHTHRLGAFFHRDANGNHVWVETGCTCQLNPEYAQDPDWQAGCVVMTFEPTTGAFQVELVYIHEGTAVFRGQWIDARSGK